MLSIILIAVSLSIDTFSVALACGIKIQKKSYRYIIPIIVGMFHFFMPLIGLKIGDLITSFIMIDHKYILFGVFMLLAIQMLFSKNDESYDLNNILFIILFAFAVSIDSFICGIGLNAISSNHLLTVSIFAIVSSIFTFLGLKIGHIINNVFLKYSNYIGATILLIISLLNLL